MWVQGVIVVGLTWVGLEVWEGVIVPVGGIRGVRAVRCTGEFNVIRVVSGLGLREIASSCGQCLPP